MKKHRKKKCQAILSFKWKIFHQFHDYPSEEISPDRRRSLHRFWKSISPKGNGDPPGPGSPSIFPASFANLKSLKNCKENDNDEIAYVIHFLSFVRRDFCLFWLLKMSRHEDRKMAHAIRAYTKYLNIIRFDFNRFKCHSSTY